MYSRLFCEGHVKKQSIICACLIGYAGSFRSKELLIIRRCDSVIYNTHMSIFIESSKTAISWWRMGSEFKDWHDVVSGWEFRTLPLMDGYSGYFLIRMFLVQLLPAKWGIELEKILKQYHIQHWENFSLRHLNHMYPTYRGAAYILCVQEVQQLLLVMVSQIGSLSAMGVGLVKAPRIDIS